MSTAVTIEWYDGPREALRDLFAMAEDSPDRVEASLAAGRVLVARDAGGAIVGHLQLASPGPGVVEVASVAVVPRMRGAGVGARLVAHALEAARAEGAVGAEVTTAMADIGNLRFYQRCGFRAAAIVRDAFTPQDGYPPGLEAGGIPVRDAIRFTMPLGPGPGISASRG